MKPPRKNKRGPIAGKPNPSDAKIVHAVNEGLSQSKITERFELKDEDPNRKIRRIMRKIEAACSSRDKRRIYEAGINNGRPPKERMTIFSTDYDAHLAFPELAQKAQPRLVTKEELFEILDVTHRDSIERLKGKSNGES